MKLLRKRTLYVVLCLLVLSGLSISFVYGVYTDRRAATVRPRDAQIRGLKESVTVQFDARGIPYIHANNRHDLYMAQGYLIARDRLWQMDLLRRTARGELAEILGRPVLEEDKRRRLYNFSALADDMFERSSPEFKEALVAYAEGVNAFINSRQFGTWPIEFTILRYAPQPWRPSDSLVITKLFAEALSGGWRQDIERAALQNLTAEQRQEIMPVSSPLDVILVSDQEKTKQKVVAASRQGSKAKSTAMVVSDVHADDLAAIAQLEQRTFQRVGLYQEGRTISNAWVVSGRFSVSGKPLLANDPHLDASAPSIWYMAHLSTPDLRVAGVTIPGLPGIMIGHNEQIAWGITNMVGDVQDLYAERFNSSSAPQYLAPDGWRQAEIQHEQIKVREGNLGLTTSIVPYDVTVTRHGPIIFAKADVHYALRWTAFDRQASDYETFFHLNSARNLDDLRATSSRYTGPPVNLIFATTDGHIGFYALGRIPIRSSGDGTVPYDGTTAGEQWTSYIPFAEMPNSLDPPSGMIVTANQRLVDEGYRYHITSAWPAPYRAHRISELLKSKAALSLDDFVAIAGDTFSYADGIFANEVLKFARVNAGTSPEWQAILATLDGWDGKAGKDSRALLLTVRMRKIFQQKVLSKIFGDSPEREFLWLSRNIFIDRIITTRPANWLPEGFDSYEALILACYKDALTEIRQAFGPNEALWTWGNGPPRNFIHPLAGIPYVGARFALPRYPRETGGSGDTVNAGSSVSMRFVCDLNDWDQTRQSLSVGQSGDPSSPHYKDQIDDWHKVAPRAFPFSEQAVLKAATIKISLTPGR